MNQNAANQPLPHHITLIGFMGSGKTTTGRELARLLDRKQVDMDQLIEEEKQLSVSDIFRIHGEAYFRDLESHLIQGLVLRTDPAVICSGGGIVLREENIKHLKGAGALVWLKASPGEIYRRISGDGSRPLLKDQMTVEKISDMLEHRRPLYEAAADVVVDTDGKTTEEICRDILAGLKGLAASGVVKLKGLTLGEGPPKICIPLTGVTRDQLVEECEQLKLLSCDLVEWRADFFEGVDDVPSVVDLVKEINRRLAGLPLIFTLRSASEGGCRDISVSLYTALNEAVMATGLVDAVDVELLMDESLIRHLVGIAREKKVAVIISNHDFEKTPAKEVMVARLLEADRLGGDILKLAVMPACRADVLALMDATRTVREDHGLGPLITMAMGGLGVVSRLSGEIFGSDVTFGSAGKASAPGQLPADELYRIVHLIHRQLKGP